MPDDTAYEYMALMGKALGSASRLKLLELLSQGERSVQDLASASQLTLPNTSNHLQTLRQAGLVASTRSGTSVCYRLADDETVAFLVRVREFANDHIVGLRQAIEERFGGTGSAGMEPVSRDRLMERLAAEDVTLIDVRPPNEFKAAHIAGAINIPLPELQQHIEELRGRDIVAYCRGPFCVLSWKAVDLLRSHGITATRLEDGLPEWRLSGLPVHSATRGED